MFGITVKMFDLQLKCCEFDSRLGRYQVVTFWMGDLSANM